MRPHRLAAVLLMATLGCDDALPPAEPSNPEQVSDGVRLRWPGGRTVDLTQASATCRMVGDAMEVVSLTAPARWAEGGEAPVLTVSVVTGVVGPQELPLPRRARFVGPSDVTVVATRPGDGVRFGGFPETASGRIEVVEAGCDADPVLSFTIDAALVEASGRRTVQLEGGLASSGGRPGG